VLGFVVRAQRRNTAWSDLAPERLPHILEISARIEALCEVAPDSVMTHGDFKTHNMLKTPTGQVLVDWDSVRVDSAAPRGRPLAARAALAPVIRTGA
jgi:aminoglycoside phosphotransferase (APT) family kinase protein